MAQLGGQPILIMKEGTERTRGRDAMENNIAAAKVIAEAVRTSLGPRGMDKMLVDQFGDVVITNDGATILKEIDVQHPAAKIAVRYALIPVTGVAYLTMKIHPAIWMMGFILMLAGIAYIVRRQRC